MQACFLPPAVLGERGSHEHSRLLTLISLILVTARGMHHRLQVIFMLAEVHVILNKPMKPWKTFRRPLGLGAISVLQEPPVLQMAQL